jgi:hypothetical protein
LFRGEVGFLGTAGRAGLVLGYDAETGADLWKTFVGIHGTTA